MLWIRLRGGPTLTQAVYLEQEMDYRFDKTPRQTRTDCPSSEREYTLLQYYCISQNYSYDDEDDVKIY